MNTFLVVGLGNPGSEYALTRHNIGFMALDFLAKSYNVRSWNTELKAHTTKIKTDFGQLILVKPQTYMNKSGESVVPLLHYYKIPTDQMLVLHDEIDLPFLSMRLQKNRGAGGNNGIKSIHEQLGHADYARLKLGIGRPPRPGPDVSDWVLGRFNNESMNDLGEFLNKACDATLAWAEKGLAIAANQFNV